VNVGRFVSASRTAVVDAAAAVLLPTVLLLAPLNAVVIRNVDELQYHPSVVRAFVWAAVILWLAGLVVIRLWGHTRSVRVLMMAPWCVLLFDVVGAALERAGATFPAMVAADIAIVGVVVATGVLAPGPVLRRVTAAAGVAMFAHAVWQHAVFAASLSPDVVVELHRTERGVKTPRRGVPGNVYHLLLDNYLSESFAHAAGPTAATRFPGFTYYRRFNTNFPRTSSSELALIHGRTPFAGLSLEDWPQLAMAEGLWADLWERGVNLWIYPYARWLCPDAAVKCVASSELARDVGSTATRDSTIDLWALRIMPASLRHRLATPSEPRAERQQGVGFSVTEYVRQLRGINRSESTDQVNALPTQYFNLKQFDELLADEAKRPARGQYVYYHALIPHPNYIMNERCELVEKPVWGADAYWGHVACANLMIERLVQELRRLGRYDDSLIVVHADHGDVEFLVSPDSIGSTTDFALDDGARRYQAVDTTYHDRAQFEQIQSGDSNAWRSIAVEVLSSGLLLVKYPRARKYSESLAPVQLLDIAPTISKHFGARGRSYAGLPLAAVPANRESVFYAHSRSFDGKLSKYRLTDHGWQFVEDIPVLSAADP
jgi:hypothetical protein